MLFFEKAKLSRFCFSLECDALSRSIINDRRAHQNTVKLVTGWFVAFVGSFGAGEQVVLSTLATFCAMPATL